MHTVGVDGLLENRCLTVYLEPLPVGAGLVCTAADKLARHSTERDFC